MTKERQSLIAGELIGWPGRMISGSKSGYRRLHPGNIVVFNANLCTDEGKFWHGDLDVTLNGKNLQKLADRIGQRVYVLSEMDARFEREHNPAFDQALATFEPRPKTKTRANTLDLLNAEGPIMQAERRADGIWVEHLSHKVEAKVTPTELESLLRGEWQFRIPSKVSIELDQWIDLTQYPADMLPTATAVNDFLRDSRVKPLVYVASPYTHPDPAEVERRYLEVTKITADLVNGGMMAISPITYGHTLAAMAQMPGDWNFWMGFCLSLLNKCDKLLVVKMQGWEESKGVHAEIAYAREHGIEVEFMEA